MTERRPKVTWIDVANVDTHHCAECYYLRRGVDHHPYGETTAAEHWSECALGESVGAKPEDCPGIQAAIQDGEFDEETV